ncbi:MAG: sulfatase, partial [Acidobacteriota bacterium]
GWTRTSVASLMTGLLPPSHGVYDRDDKLSGAARTLAGELRDHGYETYAAVTNGIVSQAFGFHTGFDRYEYLQERADERIHRYSDEVHEVFVDWLDERDGDRPFFAYLHTMDPHSPYTPPEPYRSRFAPDGPRTGLRFPRDAKPLAADGDFTPEQVRDDMVALYDAEIAHNDETFGRLMDALRERGLYDELVVVLLSDHGEEFLDHGRYEHLKTLYREMIHVPLIVKLPGADNGGGRTRVTAQHVDLLPTLLQLAGASVPDWTQGASLLPALEAPARTWRTRSVRSYMRVDVASVASLVQGRWHLIREPMTPGSPEARSLELYDLDDDPAESLNLAHEIPVRTGLLLADWARAEARDVALLDAETAVIDEDLRDRLRALGYVR